MTASATSFGSCIWSKWLSPCSRPRTVPDDVRAFDRQVLQQRERVLRLLLDAERPRVAGGPAVAAASLGASPTKGRLARLRNRLTPASTRVRRDGETLMRVTPIIVLVAGLLLLAHPALAQTTDLTGSYFGKVKEGRAEGPPGSC